MVLASPASVWTSNLEFSMQTQLQTEWCWAASSSSVSHFYDPASTFSQCSIVNNQLGQATCCADGSTDQCNTPYYLNQALTYTGNLASVESNPPPFAQLVSEFAAGRVVCARIGWNGGGGHFLALDAVDVPNQRIQVCDPINGTSDYAYTDFVNAYRGMGTCTTGYLTKASALAAGGGGGGAAPTVLHPAVREELTWASARLMRAARLRQASEPKMSSDQPMYKVYFIGLDDAAAGGSIAKAMFIGYQSMVQDPSTQTTASVEVNVDVNDELRSPHTTHGPFATSMSAQSREISDLTNASDFQEYRYLKIPALQISALWIAFDGRDGIVVPLAPAPSPLQPGKRYAAADFESAIAPLAKKRLEFDESKNP